MSLVAAAPDPRVTARYLAAYAKEHHAGAFATPTAKELAAHPEMVRVWDDGNVAIVRRLDHRARRRDFTGRPYELPAGATVVTHLARPAGAAVVDYGADYVMAYSEDHVLTLGLRAQGLAPLAYRITAASEIIGIWGPPARRRVYDRADLVTITTTTLAVPPDLRRAMLSEVLGIRGWHDDFPFYSDGTWSALSLRGYRPSNPRWGIKPSEMPRKWRMAHPEAIGYRCGWTTLARRCPTMVDWVKGVSWWRHIERVRLLRMAGVPGEGLLGRHCDITDRDAGTHDGAVARFHVPLVTHPDVTMTTWDLDGTHTETHVPRWSATYLDARKPHAVTNRSGHDRIHLVVDVYADADVRRAITGDAA